MRCDQTYEFLVLAAILDPNVWFATLVNDCEWEVFDIGLHFSIGEFAANETLGIENAKDTISNLDRNG